MVDKTISTSNLIAGFAVLIMAFGSGAALVQSQFASADRALTVADVSSKDRDAQLHDGLNALDAQMKASVVDVNNELRHDVVSRAEFEQFQARYDASLAHIDRLDAQLGSLDSKLAHEPVEKATVDAITLAIGQRIDLIQSNITDINRQIAAALIIIDNNSAGKKSLPSPP